MSTPSFMIRGAHPTAAQAAGANVHGSVTIVQETQKQTLNKEANRKANFGAITAGRLPTKVATTMAAVLATNWHQTDRGIPHKQTQTPDRRMLTKYNPSVRSVEDGRSKSDQQARKLPSGSLNGFLGVHSSILELYSSAALLSRRLLQRLFWHGRQPACLSADFYHYDL